MQKEADYSPARRQRVTHTYSRQWLTRRGFATFAYLGRWLLTNSSVNLHTAEVRLPNPLKIRIRLHVLDKLPYDGIHTKHIQIPFGSLCDKVNVQSVIIENKMILTMLELRFKSVVLGNLPKCFAREHIAGRESEIFYPERH